MEKVPVELVRGCNQAHGRQILADWLEEQGEPAVAALIRWGDEGLAELPHDGSCFTNDYYWPGYATNNHGDGEGYGDGKGNGTGGGWYLQGTTGNRRQFPLLG